MSFIVKGMSLPQSCRTCRFSYFTVGIKKRCEMSGDEVNPLIDKREINCPLSVIPSPHGRLIDADKLLKSIEIMREQRCKTCSSRIDTKHCDRNGCWMIFISDFIGSLPTIIEAEESE